MGKQSTQLHTLSVTHGLVPAQAQACLDAARNMCTVEMRSAEACTLPGACQQG